MTISVLYCTESSIYRSYPDLDLWPESRDARLYPGPNPVIAHPPCARWCALAHVCQKLYGLRVGDDGGCFESALAAVRRWGGVLEHPACSIAWKHFKLQKPHRGEWVRAIDRDEWVTEISQCAYGHRARKRTWLLFVGPSDPPDLDWREPEVQHRVGGERPRGRHDYPKHPLRGLGAGESLATPRPFAELLISLGEHSRGTGGQYVAREFGSAWCWPWPEEMEQAG